MICLEVENRTVISQFTMTKSSLIPPRRLPADDQEATQRQAGADINRKRLLRKF